MVHFQLSLPQPTHSPVAAKCLAVMSTGLPCICNADFYFPNTEISSHAILERAIYGGLSFFYRYRQAIFYSKQKISVCDGCLSRNLSSLTEKWTQKLWVIYYQSTIFCDTWVLLFVPHLPSHHPRELPFKQFKLPKPLWFQWLISPFLILNFIN